MSSIKLAIKQQYYVINLFQNSFQKDFKFEEYLIRLSKQDRVYITKLRTLNLKLPIETERCNNIAKELRLCSFCNKKIEDEYHILFTCSNDRIVQLRQKHIPNYYWNPPVIYKMEGLFRLWNNQLMTNISRFIKKYFTIIITIFYI